MAAKDDFLIDLLVGMGQVTQEQLDSAQELANLNGEGVVDTLVQQGVLQPIDVTRAMATYYGTELVELTGMRLSDDIISLVPRHLAKKYNVVPIGKTEGGGVIVAVADPSDLEAIDSLRMLLNTEVEVRVALPQEIEETIENYYGSNDNSLGKMIQEITEGEVDLEGPGGILEAADDGSTVDADAPIIKLVNSIIVDAFKSRASDIHLEPMAKTFRVRYRIDGNLHEVKGPPKRLQSSVITRLKIQSNMSISEKRIPQDGRIQMNIGGKSLDFRVSCLPTTHGESIVMRILDKEGIKLGLAELGFLTDDQQVFEHLISLPDGILLVTGPTGSGKTTTLYACLNYINRPDRKIITVEDPVEYVLSGINQVHVNEAVGLSFSSALRAILRQAPNIIMVGEIRDLETASIAINASLTGHLVFSTLHTNDAPSAVTRLIDIGVKPFLIATSARAFMAQRLVRKICKKCGAPASLTEHERTVLGIDEATEKAGTVMLGKGCPNCKKGYRGRLGIFEIFQVGDEARKLIYEKLSASVLRQKARELGMRTLREDGIRKILAGMTSAEEVIQTTVSDFEQ
ncbi:MAG: Flp pilus assembly complex ATPase component TadA [Verrucomicrobia bacterium]|nr:Flp pilus assembly complex ATPase component TadA [Verrucomicrobiota bacterium]